jgi:trigger factor
MTKMQVTETNAEGLKHDFKVVIEANDIAQKVDARLADVGKDIRLPGFRPGKVPMKILKQRFGGSVLGEVLDQTIRESSTSLFEERGLRPAGQPKIEVTSFDEGKDLEFDVSIEVLPEIETMDLSTIEIEKLTVETGDEEVDAALQRIAEQNKTSEPITGKRMSKKGDVVVIDFVGSIDGTPFDGGKADDYPLELGSNSFIPGFEEQLIGVRAGESKDVEVSFPEEKLPEIDDAFASNLGLENLDALKDAIREQIGGEYAQVARDAMKRKLLDILAEAHEFELPEGMLDSEFEGIWQQVEKARENDQLDEDDKARSEDELREQYRNIALRRVRLGLLLSDIGEKNGLTVSQEEVNRAIMQQARQMPGQEQQVIEYFRGSPDAQRSLQAPIFEDKVVDFIVEMAKVTERTVSVEELTAAATGDDGEGKSAKPKAKSGGRKKKAASAKKNKEEAGDDAAAEADEV